MPRLTSRQFHDEAVYRQMQVQRYANGQIRHVRGLIGELTAKLSRRAMHHGSIETKGQYADMRTYVRQQCLLYRRKLNEHLDRELKGFVREQAKWTYEYSPKKLRKADNGRMLRNVSFNAFSDTDTIRTWLAQIFNRIFQLWNSQLTIAHRLQTPMAEMIKAITGEYPK